MPYQVVYKYKLLTGMTVLDLPENAKILKVGIQNNEFCIWCQVSPDNPTTQRIFSIVGTGWHYLIDDKYNYIDTVFEDLYVWHIYEVISDKQHAEYLKKLSQV